LRYGASYSSCKNTRDTRFIQKLQITVKKEPEHVNMPEIFFVKVMIGYSHKVRQAKNHQLFISYRAHFHQTGHISSKGE
jgi:hypothetical protein